MRQKLLALMICVFMVTIIALPNVVSAADAGQSTSRQYDIKFPDKSNNIVVYGALTVDVTTGKYVVNADLNKLLDKTQIQKVSEQYGDKLNMAAIAESQSNYIVFGPVTLNTDGTIHGEGIITDDVVYVPTGYDIVGWLETYGNDAYWSPAALN